MKNQTRIGLRKRESVLTMGSRTIFVCEVYMKTQIFFDLNQPDIVNPENYPHVHPPPDLYLINEELPDDNEIKNAVSN